MVKCLLDRGVDVNIRVRQISAGCNVFFHLSVTVCFSSKHGIRLSVLILTLQHILLCLDA